MYSSSPYAHDILSPASLRPAVIIVTRTPWPAIVYVVIWMCRALSLDAVHDPIAVRLLTCSTQFVAQFPDDIHQTSHRRSMFDWAGRHQPSKAQLVPLAALWSKCHPTRIASASWDARRDGRRCVVEHLHERWKSIFEVAVVHLELVFRRWPDHRRRRWSSVDVLSGEGDAHSDSEQGGADQRLHSGSVRPWSDVTGGRRTLLVQQLKVTAGYLRIDASCVRSFTSASDRYPRV